MRVLVFADVGPVFLGLLGLVPVAALFGAAAVVAGGYWLLHGRAAPWSRRVFLGIGGLLCLCGAAMASARDFEDVRYPLVAVMLALSVWLLGKAVGAFGPRAKPVAGQHDAVATETSGRPQK
jgi:hypothetical protein